MNKANIALRAVFVEEEEEVEKSAAAVARWIARGLVESAHTQPVGRPHLLSLSLSLSGRPPR